ncbi:alpha/beta fold hydrolase [Alicyclobacillaceae bacterium I2511]|nr:alpha/beta fold hydrolase [Alicyclobacillaceae bacterium I2511]
MEADLCVLVHGFTGTPEELAPLTAALVQEGYRVLTPLLPGHGQGKRELAQATATQWLQAVESLVQTENSPGSVHLIGFSMGAMLAGVVASRHPVASLTLLAPAVYYVGTRQIFRQIAGVIKDTWHSTGSRRGDFLQRRIEDLSEAPLSGLKQFRRMVNLGKSSLPTVTAPVCIVQGSQDATVEPRGAEYVRANLGSTEIKLHFLPESDHLMLYGPNAQEAIDLVVSFVQQHSPHAPKSLGDSVQG